MEKITKNLFKTIFILVITNLLAILMMEMGAIEHSVSALFIITVVIVALNTEGYIYGIIASIYGVFAINYFFMYPYYAFDFTLSGYPLTLFMVVIVSILTSYLLDSYKELKQNHYESEKEKEIEKTRANLLRFLSHDLRTPLTSIISAISLIDENKDMKEETKQLLMNDIKINAKWQLQMVEDLLLITRVINEPDKIKMQDELTMELIETIIKREKRYHNDIEFDVKLADEILLIHVNAMLIGQVLQNIIENAYKYGDASRKIEIETKRKKDKVYILIKDRGKGVEKEKQKDLFTSEILDKEETRKDGFGIGLYLCDKIMKVHNGSITYKDRTNGGACFILEFPAVEGVMEYE